MVATFGTTREEALAHAVDAIETALASPIADGETIPAPDAGDRLKPDEAVVRLPASTALKVQLVWALKAAGLTRAELARRVGGDPGNGGPPFPARYPPPPGQRPGGLSGRPRPGG